GHPAGGAATPPPPPPAPARELRPPARCPSASSLAATRLPKRSPPSPHTSTSARARRRLMLTESLAPQPEIVQQVRIVLEDLLLVHQVLMGAAEHSMPYRASLPYHPKAPIQHPTPRPTTIPHRPCACIQIEARLSSEVSDRQPISPGLRPRLPPGTGRAGGTA